MQRQGVDSTDSRYVYAVWDRLQTAEPDNPASAFSGDTLFARSTDVLFAATHGRSAYSIRLESRPTVAISGPSELRVGEPVTYGASGQAYDGGAVRLAWQLPGTPSTGAGTSVSFTPVAPGQATVRVTATDANGLAGTAERAVTISPAQAVPTPGSQGRDTSKPTLRVRKVKQVRRPKRSAIRGRATDASGIARVTVRFGDGKRKRVRPSRTGRFTVKHRYGTVASYEATVTAVDEAGNARTKHAKVRVRKRRTGRA